MTKVLYEHDCKGSARYHMNKYKHWAKLVTGVDTSKTNGYAFEGEFLSVYNEHKLETGSLVVECCGGEITLYRVTGDSEKEELDTAGRKSMSGLIAKAAEELEKNKAPEARLATLLEKKNQLLKELELVEEEIKKLQ